MNADSAMSHGEGLVHEQIERSHRHVTLERRGPQDAQSRARGVERDEARVLLLRRAEPDARDRERIGELRDRTALMATAVPRSAAVPSTR